MPEQEKIPLLSLFSAWVPPADLRPMLVEMLVTGAVIDKRVRSCLLYTSPSPRDTR